MALKDQIKRECRIRNITQTELAEELDMKPSNFNNQINRHDTVQLGLIKKICQKLSISVGVLVDENDDQLQTEDEQMILNQLKIILEGGDEDTVDLIVGKIAREYVRVTAKKDDFRNSI